MNALDIVILVPLAWGIFVGLRKGFVKQISGLIFLIGGIWLAATYSEKVSPWFSFAGEVGGILSFVCIVAATLLLGFLIALILTKLLEKLTLGPLNKIAGAALGALKYGLLLSLVLNLMVRTGKKISALDISSRHNSLFYPYISKMAPLLIPKMENSIELLIEKNTPKKSDS
jgi:membrane protein required for colicin V production